MPTTDYTYIDRVKRFGNFQLTPAGTAWASISDDTDLLDYITASSEAWNELTSQVWYQQTAALSYSVRKGDVIVNSEGDATIRLDVPVINSITAISWQSANDGSNWNALTDTTRWELDSLKDGSRLYITGQSWARYRHNLRLSITADIGYPTTTVSLLGGGTATYTNVPKDIQIAVTYMAVYGYKVIRAHSDGILAQTEWGAVKIGDMAPGYIQSTINRYTAGITRV